ncbi:hypothetical protein DL89DRAFT_255049 [Linderina pennispora]|uniref:C3H1-type domain-containing protein n=1 Tax=Linderina pennispora TaxID=61395 RepID=A0A1Y1WH35_9FUNG|nr:uncharacterized protein DL89DRAFT_255049 [Linderina pennispora]ORX72880.1 hypothetical protein DL89DRAFT_255049 [Linderina pennispora]
MNLFGAESRKLAFTNHIYYNSCIKHRLNIGVLPQIWIAQPAVQSCLPNSLPPVYSLSLIFRYIFALHIVSYINFSLIPSTTTVLYIYHGEEERYIQDIVQRKCRAKCMNIISLKRQHATSYTFISAIGSMRVGVAGILAATVVAEADSSRSTAGSFIYPQESPDKPVLEVLSASLSRQASWAATNRYRNSTNNRRSYKTRLCENFKQSGTCIYGDKGKDCAFGAKCDFAHGEEEMLENRKRVTHELYPEPVRFRAPDDVFQDRFAEKHAAKRHSAMRKSLSALMIPLPQPVPLSPPIRSSPTARLLDKLENAQNLHHVAHEMLPQPGLVASARELTALQHVSLPNCEREPALQASPICPSPPAPAPAPESQYSNTTGLPAQQKYGNTSSAFAIASSSVPYSGLAHPSDLTDAAKLYTRAVSGVWLADDNGAPFSQTQIPPMQFISSGYMPFGPAVVPALRTAVSLDQDMLESGSFGQYMDQHPGIPNVQKAARATPWCHRGNAAFNGSPLSPHSPMVFRPCSSGTIPVPGENIGSLVEMRLSDHFEQRANRRVGWTPDIVASLAPLNLPEESDISGGSKGSFDYRAMLLGTNMSNWADSVNTQRFNRGA